MLISSIHTIRSLFFAFKKFFFLLSPPTPHNRKAFTSVSTPLPGAIMFIQGGVLFFSFFHLYTLTAVWLCRLVIRALAASKHVEKTRAIGTVIVSAISTYHPE